MTTVIDTKIVVGISIGGGTVDLRIDTTEGTVFATWAMTPSYAKSLAAELVAASERVEKAEQVKSRPSVSSEGGIAEIVPSEPVTVEEAEQ